MLLEIIVALIGVSGTVAGAVLGWQGKRGETRGTAEAEFRDDLMHRLDDVTAEVREAEQRWRRARDEAMAVQMQLHQVVLGMGRALDALLRVRRELDAGHVPPAPVVAEAIEDLRRLIEETSLAHPREPPA